MARYEVDEEDAKDMDVGDWADESFEIASTYAYEGIEEGGVVSGKYIYDNEEIALQRIVLAGHRLAYLLT